uniref:Uncharacterized protein n=1 Tax=Schizaphis graminum TaxID=13262 RepID=A0A2S2NTX4_SCHGA
MKKIIKEKCHADEFLTLKDVSAYQQFCISSYNNITVYAELRKCENMFFSTTFLYRGSILVESRYDRVSGRAKLNSRGVMTINFLFFQKRKALITGRLAVSFISQSETRKRPSYYNIDLP